ncbi:NAD-dependent epimerase/dehydratase family protein [Hyphomicrobium sp. CS1GBMeth3]|uniref:NAD-dependent epimerase/dehydratase family protein n=1 Tax=Hyphomicrobium sp. CS1GBMeth3 TaxID=1892845 RepID=UPI0009318A23|nr:NAD-dependent epimerase/dehydratase family protein [Hyphomicrobium sp. CS1GBMeth3]
MKRICITGARGFIGQHLVQRLMQAGYPLTLAVRRVAGSASSSEGRIVEVGDIGEGTDWRRALEDCGVVVHLAGQTPAPGVSADLFRRVNEAGTARLAAQCAGAGVETLIFLSSIFAVVDHTFAGVVDDAVEPRSTTPYGRSKLAAEAHIRAFTGEGRTGVSLRPPLVYGAQAKGNWHSLQRLAASGLPLPFGSVRNRRSLISVENLCDAIVHIVGQSGDVTKAGAFAVADAEAVSLADMLRLLRAGMKLSPRLLPVPPAMLTAGLGLLGRTVMGQSLVGDLAVDSSRFRETYGWTPPERAEDAIQRSGRAFAAQGKHGVRTGG